jgi:hypothetical protein
MLHETPGTAEPSGLLKVPLLALLFALAGRLMAEGSAGQDPGAPHPEVRAQILSEFRFIPPDTPPAPTPPVLAAPAQAPGPETLPFAGPDIVTMAPFTVRETTRMEELHAAILKDHSAAVTAAEMRRLGVGLHEISVGPLHLFAGTVFYVPFVVGGGFAW